MRFIVPSVVVLATSATALKVSVGTNCLDVSKDFWITWDAIGDVGPELSFDMWNQEGGHDEVMDPLPIGDPKPFNTSDKRALIPAVPAAKADQYRHNRGGPTGFTIRVIDPQTYSDPFTIAGADGRC